MTHKHHYSVPSADDQNTARCVKCGQLQPTIGGAQFTPGPWEHKGNRVYRENSYAVAWIEGQGPHSEWSANGKLIAAAPAMYEALQAINAVYRGDWDNPALVKYGPLEVERKETVLRIARAALAQAEGR